MADWKQQRQELKRIPASVIAIMIGYSPLTLWDVALESDEIRRCLADPWENNEEGVEREMLFMSNIITTLLISPKRDGILILVPEALTGDWSRGIDSIYSFYIFLASVGVNIIKSIRARIKPEHRMWPFVQLILTRGNEISPFDPDDDDFSFCAGCLREVETGDDQKEIEKLEIVPLLNQRLGKILDEEDINPTSAQRIIHFSRLRRSPLVTRENKEKLDQCMAKQRRRA